MVFCTRSRAQSAASERTASTVSERATSAVSECTTSTASAWHRRCHRAKSSDRCLRARGAGFHNKHKAKTSERRIGAHRKACPLYTSNIHACPLCTDLGCVGRYPKSLQKCNVCVDPLV
eukprot:scaffold12567_cov23-Tisochrysis_lutea.AAC.1